MRWLRKKLIRVSVLTSGLMLLAATPLFAQQCPGGVCQMPAGYLTAPPVSGMYRTVPAARPRVLMSPHRRAALTTTWATFVPTAASSGGWVFVPERGPARAPGIIGVAVDDGVSSIYPSETWPPLPHAPRMISTHVSGSFVAPGYSFPAAPTGWLPGRPVGSRVCFGGRCR